MPLSAAVAGLIGTGLSSALNFASQARTNAHNRAMAEDAWRKEQEAIKRQNEYNTPANQVLRLKAAGLSPNLAYGGSGELTGQQTDIASYNPLPSEAPRVSDLGEPFIRSARLGLDAREQENRDLLARAELAVKDEQAFMLHTNGVLNEAESEEIISLLGFKEQKYLNEQALDDANYKKILQDIEESKSKVALNEKEVEQLDSLISLNDAKASEIWALLPARIRNLDAQTLMYEAQAGLLDAEVGQVAEQIATLQFNRALDRAEFKREGVKYNNEVRRWKAEQKIQIENNHANRVVSVFRVLLGGAMVRKGVQNFNSPSTPPRGVSGHHGAGSSPYPTSRPATNSAGVPLGRGYMR